MLSSSTTLEPARVPLRVSINAPTRPRDYSTAVVIAAAIVGLCLKLAIAYNTFGTNDSLTFYAFARSLSDHGLEWTYHHGVIWLSSSTVFNHPPVTAYFLRFIYYLSHTEVCLANGL